MTKGHTSASSTARTSSVPSSAVPATSVPAPSTSTSTVALGTVPRNVAYLAALQAVVSAAARSWQILLPCSILDLLLHQSIRRPYLLRQHQHWGSRGSSGRPHCSGNRPSLSEERCIHEKHGPPHHLVLSVGSFDEEFFGTNSCSR